VLFKYKEEKVVIAPIFVVSILAMLLLKMFAVELEEVVALEAGMAMPNVSEFIIDEQIEAEYVTDVSKINTSVPGTYDIELQIGKKTYSSQLKIEDTVSPTGEAVEQEVWVGEVLEASEFVNNIVDATKVKLSFKEKPDFSKPGSHQVIIVLEDEGLNKIELIASLSIKEDKEPPVITGVKDQSVFVGSTISYRKKVTVKDNRDKEVELIVNSSAVNVKRVGTYEVIYTATDKSGNKATEKATFSVKEKPKDKVTLEEINKLSDGVLARIIKGNMTDKQKMQAIFTWSRNQIAYTGKSDKSDWLKGAYQGFRAASGDCFTYYATARALLTRAGYDVIPITRIPGTPTRHYWLLVNYQGQWYHFDSTQTNSKFPYACFLKTDKEVEAYTKRVMKRIPEYYTFDKSKYPARATVPLK